MFPLTMASAHMPTGGELSSAVADILKEEVRELEFAAFVPNRA
jgi:hypothetical protein